MRTPARRPASPGLALLRAISCVALGAGVALAHASVAIPFPFFSNFESAEGYAPGALASDATWTLAPPLSATIGTPAADGTQAVIYSGAAWLSLQPTPESVVGGYPITWVDYYIKPVFAPAASLSASLDPETAASTGFVKLTSEGEVYAADGDGSGGGAWQATGHRVGLDGEDRSINWLRISYRLDYERKRWDIFLDGKLALVDLGFTDDTLEGLTRFSLRGAPTTNSYFDYFYLGGVNPLFVDENNDGLPDAWLAQHGLTGADAYRYADPDGDGVDNITEFRLGLAPKTADTDGDGVFDGRELARGMNPLVADGRSYSAFPFADSFEADALGAFAQGTRQWHVTLSGSPSSLNVANAPTSGADGNKVLSLFGRDTALEREFAPTPDANTVWIDFRADLAPRAQPAPVTLKDAGAIFYFSETGELLALDGSGNNGGTWRVVGTPAQGWHRYSVRLDYNEQKWSLWVDNVLVRADLGFANAVPYFSGIKFENEALRLNKSAGIDAVSINLIEPNGLDNDADGLSNEEERVFGSNLDLPDTDGDGLLDNTEKTLGTSPTQANGIAVQLAPDASGVYSWQTSFSAAEGYASGYLAGQQGWAAAGESLVVSGETAGLSATTTDAAIERTFGASGVSRVWIRFQAKLAPGQLPTSQEVTGAISGMFGYSSPNRLAVFDGATGSWAEHNVSTAGSEWNDYVLFFDYVSKRWAMALNGRVIVQNLAFRDSGLSHLARLRVLQLGSATATQPKQSEIDEIVISSVPFAGLDLDDDSLLDSDEILSGCNPLAKDTDGDGMDDGWELDKGLNPLSIADASADKDQDGFSNLVEFQHGTDPSAATTAISGKAHWDEWSGIAGSAVRDLTQNIKFPSQYSSRSLLAGLELPPGRGVDFGTRMRAWLIPPVTGDYTFWIAGDDEAEFWLSSDETPFARQRIARNGGATAAKEWEKRPDLQRSTLISLEAGRRYYVEVLHKQGPSSSNLAIAWQIPGQARAQVSAAHLEAFPRFEDDKDEDGLPDSWEAANGLLSASASSIYGAYGDADQDGLSNFEEFLIGLNPSIVDTDADGASDFAEIELGTDPRDANVATAIGVPVPWVSGAIGGVGFQMASHNGSTVSLRTSALAFASKSDSGGFLYRTAAGAFAYSGSVQFAAIDNMNVEGGIMVRDSLDRDAPFVSITRKYNTGWIVRHRTQKGARVLYANLASSTPIAYNHFSVRRVGALISLYGQTTGGLERKLADYPVAFASDQVLFGHVAWCDSTSNPGSLSFNLGQYSELQGTAGAPADSGLTSFDSIRWLGEWDGLSTPDLTLATTAGNDFAKVRNSGAAITATISRTALSADRRVGPWTVVGTALKGMDRRGELAWDVMIDNPGLYFVEAVMSEGRGTKTTSSVFPLKLFIDSEYNDRRSVTVSNQQASSALWLSHWLPQGMHTFSLNWDGFEDYIQLQLQELRLYRVGGEDANENTVPDWMERRLHLFNGIEVEGDVFTSPISPAFVEGSTKWLNTTRLTIDGQNMPLRPSVGYRWYGYIPLIANAVHTLVFQSENGAVTRELNARWTPHDVTSGGEFSFRVGDKFLASFGEVEPGAELTLTMDGQLVPLIDGVAELSFASAGSHELVGTVKVGGLVTRTGATTLKVYAVPSLPTAMPSLLTRERVASRPTLPTGTVLNADPRLELVDVPGSTTQIAWQADDNAERQMAVRVAPDGPILADVGAPGTAVAATLDTYTKVIQTLPDGTTETETLIIMSPVRPDHAIKLEIFVSGVVFADGTRTKIFNPADLDERGQATVRILRPPEATSSVCHRTILTYKGGAIGTK